MFNAGKIFCNFFEIIDMAGMIQNVTESLLDRNISYG
jgi:hypothetical protein